MEFRDLKRQYEALKHNIDRAMTDAAASAEYIMGRPVRELETALAGYTGANHCITCANGTDALLLALRAWGAGPNDAVFVPDFTFFATAEIIPLTGATPVFVDVDEDTFNIDPVSLEDSIQKVLSESALKPKAVITVDLFGLPADYPAVRRIAEKYGLLILEDGAQGFGGSIQGKRNCSFGDISTTSFFPSKPLGCYGDGGAVFTDNDTWAEKISSLKVHGKGADKYDNVRIGMNSRLDTVQAAILLCKFDALTEYELDSVNRAADRYTECLKGAVKTPAVPDGYFSSWAQYTVVLQSPEQRDGLQKHLKEQGIPAMIYYKRPLHLQGAFKGLGYTKGDFPVSEMLCDRVLSLPIHPYLSQEEILTVCAHIRNYAGSRNI